MAQNRPVALVTGGAHRVGRQIAVSLADSGYDVAITYNTHPPSKPTGLAVQVDLTDPQSAQTVHDAVMKQIGRLNVLVNNASIYEPGDQTRQMWAIHYDAPLALCRAFEKQLRTAGGRVINMLDIQAEKPWPRYMAYCASKAAMWNLTKSLARELAPEVTVNGIAPGVVQWPEDFPESEKEKYLRRVPLGRAAPEEVAAAVLFFCRASYVTGQVLRLDGGRSLT